MQRKPSNRPQTEDGTPYLKMKELSEKTGVPWSTIQYYVNQELLPKPVKTSRNMAWYPPDFVERICKIKDLIETHKLQLSVIQRLMGENDQGYDLNPLVELRKVLFTRTKGKKSDLEDFTATTGLDSDQAQDLISAGLISPVKDDAFDKEDITAGKAFKTYLRQGVTVPELAFFSKITNQMVLAEMKMREKHTENLSYEKDAAVTTAFFKEAEVLRLYVHNRILEKKALARKSLKDR